MPTRRFPTAPLAWGAVFNLASGAPRRIGDILDRLIELSGMAITTRVDPARLRPVEIPTVSGNADLAFRELGWKAVIPFDKTLRDVLGEWQAEACRTPAGVTNAGCCGRSVATSQRRLPGSGFRITLTKR